MDIFFFKRIPKQQKKSRPPWYNHISCSRTPKQRTTTIEEKSVFRPLFLRQQRGTLNEYQMSRRFWIKDYIDILVVVPKNPNLTYWKTVEPTATSSFACWHNEIFQNLFFNPHDDDDDELAKNLQPLSICCEQHSYLHSAPKSKIYSWLFASKVKK